MNNTTQFLLYKGENGRIKVDVLVQDETVWLSIEQMAELFGKARSTVNEHILNIYKEGELLKDESMRKIGNSDFSTEFIIKGFTMDDERLKDPRQIFGKDYFDEQMRVS